jgi:hypothetical protein
VLRGEDSIVTPDQIKSWMAVNYQYLSKKERQYLAPPSINAAENHVIRYYKREKGNWDRIKEAEVEISLVKDQYILKGSVDAFLNAIVAALTASAVIGPMTNCSMSSFGILGSASGAGFLLGLIGIHAPCLHDMPQTQNS